MGLASCARTNATPAPLEIRVVVVTTFEVGNDSGDEAGEFQNWVEHYPLSAVLPFPQGYHPLRYNADDHVLGIVTGVGKSQAAASIMALGLDPRFISARLTGSWPASRASTPTGPRWAPRPGLVLSSMAIWPMDRCAKIPAHWSSGIALRSCDPSGKPAPPAVSKNGNMAHELNDGFVTWACDLTRGVALRDDDKLKRRGPVIRTFAYVLRPPFVLKGDTLTADRFRSAPG